MIRRQRDVCDAGHSNDYTRSTPLHVAWDVRGSPQPSISTTECGYVFESRTALIGHISVKRAPLFPLLTRIVIYHVK